MINKMDFNKFRWKNKPTKFELTLDSLTIFTDPVTDFWQRTYYDFQHDNAHAFLYSVFDKEFSFSVKAKWEPRKLFDQCGIVLYHDADNWFKASVEHDNEVFSRLGSVVTNLGYSDWATTDTDSAKTTMFYRLSRRGQDFLIENSSDGQSFKQMRIFHMHLPIDLVNIGVYACSPLESAMSANFSEFNIGECVWDLYADPEK